jgi:hypothetical protein
MIGFYLVHLGYDGLNAALISVEISLQWDRQNAALACKIVEREPDLHPSQAIDALFSFMS